jgi:hypothetical protein
MTDSPEVRSPEASHAEEGASASTVGGLARTVAWGLFGVRRSGAHQADVGRVNPLHVVLAGLIGLVLVVTLLIGMAHWFAGS